MIYFVIYLFFDFQRGMTWSTGIYSEYTTDLRMRGIPVSEKYHGIKSDGIIYRGLAKYRSQHST